MNYTELRNRVEERVENQFSDDTFADFTDRSERKIYSAVQSLVQKKNQTSTLTTDSRYLTLPSDWLYTHSLAVVNTSGAYKHLIRKDVNFIREAYPNPTSTGFPKYYAEFDELGNFVNFILGPTPNDAYAVELHYGYVPPSIVTEGSTWLGDNFPDVLYSAVVVQAGISLKFLEDIMQEYRTEYNQAILELKQNVDGRQEQDSYRNGFPRVTAV